VHVAVADATCTCEMALGAACRAYCKVELIRCKCMAQWAHFLAWPVLGTGILLALSPSHDQMANTLRKSGLAGARQWL
jgi:hypothetical protein